MKKSMLSPAIIVISMMLFYANSSANFTQADSAKAKAYCKGPFIGTTVFVGSPSQASSKAKTEIARSIVSQIKSETENTTSSEEKNGVLKEFSRYLETSKIESNLALFGFQEIESPKKLGNGEYEFKGYVCPDKVAKPYQDSLKIINQRVAIQKVNNSFCESLYKTYSHKVMFFERIIEYLGETAQVADYKKAEKECNKHCKAKLHWNPENKTAYSDIAFSKLSGVDMEASDCEGRGIKLAYNGSEPKCRKAGMYQCIHKPSLTISSCKDEKYRLLEGEEIKVYEKTEEAALETLQKSLRNGTFWNKWEQEIKQWRPKCD